MSLASEDSERADPYLHHNCEIIMPNDCASWGTLRQGGKEMWLASGRFLERAEPYDMESSRRQYEAIYDNLCKCSRDPNSFLARVFAYVISSRLALSLQSSRLMHTYTAIALSV